MHFILVAKANMYYSMEIKQESIGRKVRYLREKKQWSQSQLARKANLSNEYVGKIERGQAENIGIKTLEQLTEALEIELSELMPLSQGKDKNLSNNQSDFIHNFKKIPLLSGTVSASDFTASVNDWEAERIAVPMENIENLVAWKVRGRSMEPAIMDGDILIIERGVRFSNGHLVIAENDRGVTVKEFKQFQDGSVELRPLNPEFKTIRVNKEKDLEILGVVKKLIRDIVPNKK